jgi:hypothetical protein
MARCIAPVYNCAMARPRQSRRQAGVPRDELAAAVEARRELGKERELDVIDSFLDRVEGEIDARVDARLEERAAAKPVRHGGSDWAATWLGICSLGIGIGATGTAVGNGAAWISPFAWLAVVLVNLLYHQYRGR